MPSILLVEDDDALAQVMTGYLSGEGFAVESTSTYAAGLEAARLRGADIILMDVMLPGGDGFSLCREVRAFFNGPILMVTARDSSFDEVMGLRAGADDYLVKPVDPEVLVARLQAHLRRAAGRGQQQDTLVGALVIRRGERRAFYHGEDLDLSTAEFDALVLLAQNAGRTVTRDELSVALRGIPYNGSDRSLDLRISRLRRRFAEVRPDDDVPIKTVHGTGYLFATAAPPKKR